LPKAHVVSGRDLVKALLAVGWVVDRWRGSHQILWNSETCKSVSVPIHGNRPLPPGTRDRIMELAGLTDDDLRRLLGRR
jgi:predicted RNA binding protein YcfA (HicA-like mRNA interferase family)